MEIVLIVFLLACSAGFSGLTLGLLSLDVHELKRKSDLGDQQATLVYPIRARGSELLVTLILGNVLVNSILTVILDSITNGVMAVLLSTTLIVIFGEIVPQAVLGRYGLSFGSKIAPFMERLLWFFSPIARPLGALLDRTLGEELPTFYSKDELVRILEEHSISDESDIAEDELKIVDSALSFGDKKIEDVMTPRSMVIAVGSKEKTTIKLMNELHESGHSRFPVFNDDLDHIIGTLYLRDLVAQKEPKKVADVMTDTVIYVNEKDKLAHVLNAFYKTQHHLFIVVNEFSETVGVISIEDIIEQVLGQKIVDEFDRYEDIREVAKKNSSVKTETLK
ncbi:TPA: DUF21 domain-containing protein [Candidatus Saccharibacteria bacterium]|nr:DUF21 domain-containing protein [Candidatus Saccharibacteria bacterium]HIO87886.1 DUF21 domain-containing protein [Candidatus Saccharibacteria bacterium]